MKEQVLNITSKAKKLANMLLQARTNCSKQASFSKLVIIQLKLKILSEGVMTTNYISKSLEFIQLLICNKSWGLFLFKRNEKQNRKGTHTKNAFTCQIVVLRDYRIQFNIKILSEGVMMINFISKYLEFVQLLICKKIAGVIFV